jgi:hypothetical protein
MEKVKLFTAEGIYVTTVLMPYFLTMPEVVMWGNRSFKNTPDGYRECFSYWVPLSVEPKGEDA